MQGKRQALPRASVPANALVIGYGSIGERHARLLAQMGSRVGVVSRRPGVFPAIYETVTSALAADTFDYVVIANETNAHQAALNELITCGYAATVLVEKPLWETGAAKLEPPAEMSVYVGYVLRFMPGLMTLKALLEGHTIISAEVRAGSYLPDWRPGRDYRTTASASLKHGGGVLRDLSHELDYLLWLVGPWKRLAAIGGHRSDLEIETDDVYLLLGEAQAGAAFSVSLNYVDRVEERWIVVTTDRDTFRLDLVTGLLTVSGMTVEVEQTGIDTLYIRQHAAAFTGSEPCCTFRDGMAVVGMIEAAERAASEKRWIER
jgi:predicted dehydrogenase